MSANDFITGMLVGIALASVGMLLVLATTTSGIYDRWNLYIDCVQSEKASPEFCAEAYNAPVKGD